MASTITCSYVSICGSVLVCVLILAWGQSCYGFGTFGFDIHHRFSDPVKGILAVDDLPEKGTLEYYAAMVHRDRIIHSRRLASTTDQTPLTFSSGNMTVRVSSLGFLHYANISVGTPSLSFLVALDTGSDLLWLPCDCLTPNSCVQEMDLNIYSPSVSSTSSKVSCNSTLCEHKKQCSATLSKCPYQVSYLSENTSSTGFLVEDVLHLITDDDQSKAVDAPITFGCGQVQTGSFLDGAAPNGLFGLGIDNISVPSILANAGLASNSFSMCFGLDGIGRISFGDKGSSDQGKTPFNLGQLHPTYNISITQISVGKKVADLNFSAIFDSGTSFTYLNDPAYTLISESFNSQAQDKRRPSDSGIPFEYCYDISSNQTNITTTGVNLNLTIPVVNLTMKGGDQFPVTKAIVLFSLQGKFFYCLAVVKSENVNIIGQNFMTGYRVVFDREKMILGWKESNCYDIEDSNTLPINPGNNTAVPPAVALDPEATAGTSPPLSSHSPRLTHFTYALMMVFFPFFAIF